MQKDSTISFPSHLPDLVLYDPQSYLLSNAKKTHLPDVYSNKAFIKDPSLPSIACIIGPGGAGKDTLIKPLVQKGAVRFLVTATSRKRREGEPEGAYIWMRGKLESEGQRSYIENLIKEYDLIEYDEHNGNLYGIPKESLARVSKEDIPLIRVDATGAKTLGKLLEGVANLLVIFIVPDNLEQIWQRIQGRGQEMERFLKSIEYIKEAPSVAHFYLHNREGRKEVSQQVLEALLQQEFNS